MKKKILLFAFICISLFGCNFKSNKSFTFNVETGNQIKVSLDTSDGYNLRQKNGKFYIEKEDKKITSGEFLKKEGYEYYLNEIKNSDIKIIEEDDNDTIEYLLYEEMTGRGLSHNYIILVKDSNTGILLSTIDDIEEYEEVFERLTFTKE